MLGDYIYYYPHLPQEGSSVSPPVALTRVDDDSSEIE